MENNIPFVDLKKQYEPLKEEILSGISRVLDGMHLFLGENVQALERDFGAFCHAKHGIGVSEGTTALHVLLRAMGIGAGDEVITVPNTFIATAEAIILAGARPVFVDIDPETYLMDPARVEERITPRTKALLPVHLYGQMARMDQLKALANKYNLKIIEDACQAHGAQYKERLPGYFGDGAAYSFYFSKNLGAYGEGGFVTTNDDELARRVRMMRDHGSESKYLHDCIGMNARLDEIQALVLCVKLRYLQNWIDARRNNAKLYNELLKDTPVITPCEDPDALHVYHLYVIRAPKRDELQAHLKNLGIFTGIHYPVPIHLQKACEDLGYKKGDFPVTETCVDEILSLPMFAELTEQDIIRITSAVKDFYK